MGFVLSILYFLTSFLTPRVLFGQLADFRIELILSFLILIVSLPIFSKSFILKTPQSLALFFLLLSVMLSIFFAVHWLIGAAQAFLAVIPQFVAYFLVCLHCNSKKKLKLLVLMMLFVCLFVIAHGVADLHSSLPESSPAVSSDSGDVDATMWEIQHPYFYRMGSGPGEMIYRLRGLGLINDPNDFGQLLVCVIPLVFIFWRSKKMLSNLVCVLLPVCILLYGIYLTHSRGALLAMLAVVLMAARRRIGTIPALVLAGGLFVAAMALHVTGGREISADSGSDRTELWSEGLQALKTHPLFGVGIGNMGDYTEGHHTAHNSIVVCVVELGAFGFFFWCMFLFPSLRNALRVASPAYVSEGDVIPAEEGLHLGAIQKVEVLDKSEINHLGRLVVLSFTGFLVAGFFLSRALIMHFFLLGGIAEVVYEMALQRGMIAPRLPLSRVLRYAGVMTFALPFGMYLLLRVVHLAH